MTYELVKTQSQCWHGGAEEVYEVSGIHQSL